MLAATIIPAADAAIVLRHSNTDCGIRNSWSDRWNHADNRLLAPVGLSSTEQQALSPARQLAFD
jgi:hypothetical protein